MADRHREGRKDILSGNGGGCLSKGRCLMLRGSGTQRREGKGKEPAAAVATPQHKLLLLLLLKAKVL